MFYSRAEFASRFPLFITGSSFATATGALLSTAYHNAGEISPLIYGWRNIVRAVFRGCC